MPTAINRAKHGNAKGLRRNQVTIAFQNARSWAKSHTWGFADECFVCPLNGDLNGKKQDHLVRNQGPAEEIQPSAEAQVDLA